MRRKSWTNLITVITLLAIFLTICLDLTPAVEAVNHYLVLHPCLFPTHMRVVFSVTKELVRVRRIQFHSGRQLTAAPTFSTFFQRGHRVTTVRHGTEQGLKFPGKNIWQSNFNLFKIMILFLHGQILDPDMKSMWSTWTTQMKAYPLYHQAVREYGLFQRNSFGTWDYNQKSFLISQWTPHIECMMRSARPY